MNLQRYCEIKSHMESPNVTPIGDPPTLTELWEYVIELEDDVDNLKQTLNGLYDNGYTRANQ